MQLIITHREYSHVTENFRFQITKSRMTSMRSPNADQWSVIIPTCRNQLN